jgi:predicted transcriptional regulator
LIFCWKTDILGENRMKDIKEDWKDIVNGVKEVSGKVEKAVESLERLGKTQAAKDKKATKTDPVLEIILREEGVGVAELSRKTGLSEKEIRKAVFNLRREGKIRRVFVAMS